jgi:hypothetical protein
MKCRIIAITSDSALPNPARIIFSLAYRSQGLFSPSGQIDLAQLHAAVPN